MNIHKTLEKKYGDKKYVMRGDSYDGLEWLDESLKPTEADLEEAWQEVESEQAEEEAKKDAYDAFVLNGFDTGLGFSMAVSKDDQTAISNLMTGLKNKAPSNDSTWTLKDKDGVKHEVTYSQFKDIADDYFDYCYGAWKQL